jgi:EAL domain-containing protein (putative c-di-GMP-specific phosphodiesterase class I)
LKDCGLPLHKITFEVTESVAFGNLVFTEPLLAKLNNYRLRFSRMFGTAIHPLSSLDVDYLKIDGSLEEALHSPTGVP